MLYTQALPHMKLNLWFNNLGLVYLIEIYRFSIQVFYIYFHFSLYLFNGQKLKLLRKVKAKVSCCFVVPSFHYLFLQTNKIWNLLSWWTDWSCHIHSRQWRSLFNTTHGYCIPRYCNCLGTWERPFMYSRSCDRWKVKLYGLHLWQTCSWCWFIWIWSTG